MQQQDPTATAITAPDDATLRRLFEFSLDMLGVFDLDGVLRNVNPAFTEVLGWSEAEMTGRCFLEFLHPSDRERASQALCRRATSNGSAPGEYRWRCADGSYRWLACRSSAADENGLIYGTARDITLSRQAEAELKALSDCAAVGITMTSCDGRFIKANPAFCEMIGYTHRDLMGRTVAEITLPEDRDEQTCYIRRLVSGAAASHVVEKRYQRKDGSTFWARATISVMHGSEGNAEGLVAVVEDITIARQTMRALRERDARFQRIASNVPGMMYQSRRDADGKTSFPYVSEGAFDIYGVSAAEIRANPRLVVEAVHPDDRPRFDASMAVALEQRAPWRWAGRIVVDGRLKWIEGAARPQRLDDGATVWDGLVVDVTEARDSARKLEETENRYRSLFEHHPDAVFLLDASGRFQSANANCAALSGHDPRVMAGQPFDALVAPAQIDRAYAQFQRALGGVAATGELTLIHRSGRPVEVSVTNVPVFVADEVVGVFGIARDLTAQRELEAQLRQAQKMEAVGQLAAGVAHDFNNVLTVIQSCSEFLIGDLSVGDERRADVDMIRDAASRASILTRQLLAFSRKQVLKLATVDLNDCIVDLQHILGRMLGEDIRLVTDLAPDLALISADVSQLEQVIVNMTVNARDAMESGGDLRFTTRNRTIDAAHAQRHPDATVGPSVCLSISDDGCGMDAVTLSRMFEPFFTTKETGKGTGLGLATAYGIVRQSLGHITVASTPGLGTTFNIYLPAIVANERQRDTEELL